MEGGREGEKEKRRAEKVGEKEEGVMMGEEKGVDVK